MARNKSLKLLTEAPPEPDSSSDQQPSGSSDEAEDVAAADDTEVTSSSAASSDDEEEQEQPFPTPFTHFLQPLKKPTTVSTTVTKKTTPQSSDSSDNSDDEVPFSKQKQSKPRSKPVHTPTEKRPSENTEEKEKSSKRAKKDKPSSSGPGPGSGPVGPGEEVSKKLFQRVFSEDDEIAMLKGMIEFKERKGGDPTKNDDEFYNFIRKLLHVEVNKVQIVDKVRRLKKKFNNAKKKKITNQHEKKLFELSKRIWEVKDEDEVEEEDNNVNANVNVGVNSISPLKSNNKENNGVLGSDMKVKLKKKEDDEGGVMMVVEEGFKVGESEVKEGMRMEALRRMGVKGRDEIREMWRKVEIAELEVELMRNEARVEENKRIMEALGLVKREVK